MCSISEVSQTLCYQCISVHAVRYITGNGARKLDTAIFIN